MFPAPGVYDPPTTDGVMTVTLPLTTPVNVVVAALTLTVVAVSSMSLAWIVTVPLDCSVIPEGPVVISLPLLSWIVMVLAPSCRVICCCPGVWTTSCSLPCVSSRVIFTPLREHRSLMLLLPAESIEVGGESCPFHSPPITYGLRGLPASKATSTSSPTSGTKKLPRLLPPISVASRAQVSYVALCGSGDQGSATFTRACPSSSVMLVTFAG